MEIAILFVCVVTNLRPAHKAYPALQVANLAAARETLNDNVVKFTDDDTPPGSDRVYVQGHFGIHIALLDQLE